MTAPTHILDGRGTKNAAIVTNAGQLVTAPFGYNDVSFASMDGTGAFNLYLPRVGFQFVITSIILIAGFSVANNADAIVIVYEATSPTETTVAKILFEAPMTRFQSVQVPNANLLVNKGVYINAKTSDPTVGVNVLGYYIPELS